MRAEKLTTREFWEATHKRKKTKFVYPKANSHYFDFELDVIFKKHSEILKELLEIGCGSSDWLPYFYREFNCRVTGIGEAYRRVKATFDGLKKINRNDQFYISANCVIINLNLFSLEEMLE